MAHYSAQVPKQLYGYSLQFTECVRALLEAKGGSRVSVGVFEDVGVQDDGVETDAIQVKSGSGANPLTDNSIDLWKTIRNWIDQCNCLLLNPVHIIHHLCEFKGQRKAMHVHERCYRSTIGSIGCSPYSGNIHG
jgi:hypothetical protein